MTKCKQYNAIFSGPETCIARQKKLAELIQKMSKRKSRYNLASLAGEILNAPSAEYLSVMKCKDCKAGIKRYQKYLEGCKKAS